MGFIYLSGMFVLVILVWVVVRELCIARLRRQRKGLGRKEFVEAFRGTDVPESIAVAVYDYYASQKGRKSFPFSPDDKYSVVLYDDPADIERDARVLVQQLGFSFPTEYKIRAYSNKPPVTLRDMVTWLDVVRQHQ
jgi:hypothetical protein